MYPFRLTALKKSNIGMVSLLLCMAAIATAINCEANQGGSDRNNNPAVKKNLVFVLKDKTENPSEKDCYVWFEANTEKNLDKYLLNSKKWALIGKPIVTARSNNIETFADRLIDAGIDAIVGFKTSNVIGDNDYSKGISWEQIARTARNLSKKTKGKPVVLENEGAVKALISKGITSIDYDRLLQSISSQQWPEIWFWHGPLGEKEPLKTLSYDIARAVKNGIPNCRLIEPNSAGTSISSFNRNCQNNLGRTFDLDSNPISIVYLDNQKAKYWSLQDADQAIRNAVGNTVIIYPGIDDIENYDAVIKSIRR